MMLGERLFVFLSELHDNHQLNDNELEQITRSVLLYVMGRRNADEFRVFGRSLGIADDLYEFKSTFLDRSYYTVSQFWRVAFGYFKALSCPPSGPVTTKIDEPTLVKAIDGVCTIQGKKLKCACASDMRLIEDHLTLGDHSRIFRIARATHYETPSDVDLYPIIKKLQKHCSSVAYTKMRFLANNDLGLSLDDFANELFEAGLLTLRNYDAEYTDTAKVLNFAKAGARHHSQRLIDFYTAQRRSRIVRVIDNEKGCHKQQRCGTCAMFDTKDSEGRSCEDRGMLASYKPCKMRSSGGVYHSRVITEEHACGNCQFYDSPLKGSRRSCININVRPYDIPCEFFESKAERFGFLNTTMSLEHEMTSNTKDAAGPLRLIDTIEDESCRHDRSVDEQRWLTDLLAQVPDNVARIVKITLGDTDNEFDSWLWDRSGKTADELSDAAVAKFACEFASVPMSMVRNTLSSLTAISSAVESRRAYARA